MKHHSIDYKLSAIKYYKKIGSFRKTCDIFECSKTSLQRWVKKYDDTKNISRKKRELKIVFTNEEKLFIKEYIKKYPNITLKLLTKIFNKKFNKEYHYLSIYYLLKEIKISYKILRKKYFPEKGDEKQELCEYWKELLKYNMKDIISIDESAVYINATKERGYSKKGTRAILKTDIYPYKKFNLLLGITYGKIVGFELYKEPIRKEQLINYIDKYIFNKYEKKVIILDNAKFHHNKDVKEKIKESKNNLLYSIRYNPQCNPIENYFNQLKHYIKLKSPITYEEIVNSIKEINKHNVKKEHLENYFKYLFIQGKEFVKKC